MPRLSIDLGADWLPREVRSDWIAALDRRLGWDDQPRSYRLLNAVLRAAHATLPACDDAAPDPSTVDAGLLFGWVQAGFKPDRLDRPQAAVLAVLDVLEDVIDEPRLAAIRGAALPSVGPLPFDPTTRNWSATWSSPS